MRVLCFGAMVLLAAAGCARGEKRAEPAVITTTSSPDPAVTAAGVANAIAANPAAADSILGAAGYTRDSFQELMYKIAADSGMSASYAAARTR